MVQLITLELLKNFWQSSCIFIETEKIKFCYGACTFDKTTIDFVEGKYNEKNIMFYNTCYRPFDGKHYNAFKGSAFTQMQVMLKNKKNLFSDLSKSIEYVFDKHLILEFKRDNWSAPTMSSYGVGYEVRLNHCEIVQVTNFTVFCGRDVEDLNITEITYGVDRLEMMYTKNLGIPKDRYQEYLGEIKKIEELSTDKVYEEMLCMINKETEELQYENFLKINLLLNILDGRGALSKSIKNLLMLKINKKFQTWYDARK